ncbi:hypothetical protein [Dialister succinatiphilus]|uniref:hypothetical protein n=1 Tax=Dialister succinatiphilus TaxID=487173 RepID=UPI0040276D04
MNRDKQKYKWHIKIHREGEEIPSFFASHGIPEELARILMHRGIDSEEKLSHFLYDNLDHLKDHFLMKGNDKEVISRLKAIDQH